jgi:hypothetical protein
LKRRVFRYVVTLSTGTSIIAVLAMAGATMAISHSEGDLIAAIYDAVIDPSGWDEVVKRVVKTTQ